MTQRLLLLAVTILPLAGAPTPPATTWRIDAYAGSPAMGDGGPSLAAQFGNLQGVAADRAGNIYVADTDFHRVRKVAPSGIVSTFAGTGVAGFAGDGGPAAAAQLNFPYGLAADAAGYLYIADLGNQRVRRVAPDGVISSYAGNGQKGGKGDDGPATAAQLMSPRNLALDASGNLYIAEFEGHRIRRVAPDGRITTLAGTGVAGLSGDGLEARAAQIAFPAALAVDRAGALYFCDSQNHRVRRVTQGVITTVLGGAPGTAMLTPTALAVDAFGAIYVGDRSATVRQNSAAGKWSTAAGTGLPGYDGDAGPAIAARLNLVNDLAIDLAGALLIADGSRVRRVNTQGIISTFAGDGYLHAIGDGGPPAAALLLRPTSLALDPAGTLYAADPALQRVRRVSPALVTTAAGTGTAGFNAAQLTAAQTPLDTPSAVAMDPAGNLLIADTNNQRIRRLAPDGRIWTLIGTGSAGSGAEGLAADKQPLRAPRGVCADAAGTVYAVDTGNHRVLRLFSTGLVASAAGNGSPGDGGDGGRASIAQLNAPTGCATDSALNLYIADTGNHRVRKVSPDGQIATVAGSGTAGFAGDQAPATSARLQAPQGVAADRAGNLYIADTGNHRIRQVTTDGLIHTIAGDGTAALSGDGGPSAAAQLNSPAGVAADASGVLYVADTGNARIRKLTPEVLAPAAVVAPLQISIASAASRIPGPVAPGEIVVITGVGLGPETGIATIPDAGGFWPVAIADTQVMFDGVPAPLLYVQASQVNVQVPPGVAGQPSTTVEVQYQKASRGASTVPVAEAAPALFPVAQNQDGSAVTEANPAARGAVVTFFATGEGLSDGPNIAGRPPDATARPRLPVALRIASLDAEIVKLGPAPNQVGMLQIDARVPAGFVPPGEAAVVFSVGSYLAPAFTLWLK